MNDQSMMTVPWMSVRFFTLSFAILFEFRSICHYEANVTAILLGRDIRDVQNDTSIRRRITMASQQVMHHHTITDLPHAAYLSSCDWKKSSQRVKKDIEVYWINLDRSVNRRKETEEHLNDLGFNHKRIRAMSLDDIYIPDDVRNSWNHGNALTKSSTVVPVRSADSILQRYQVMVSGLYGRKKLNSIKELGCTVSHLLAMREAIHFNKTSSKYALILEDDVHIGFDIDFNSLAKLAPIDFPDDKRPGEWGIIQLFNSNEESMENTWNQFIKTGRIFVPRYPNMAARYWSTCAYIINREVMRPIIDSLITERSGWLDLKVIAAIKNPCSPVRSECCVNKTFQGDNPICVYSPKGFQADAFLYALTNTYALSLPLITNSMGSSNSTIHQEHISIFHKTAFSRQRRYMNALKTEASNLQRSDNKFPSFVKSSVCSGQLPS